MEEGRGTRKRAEGCRGGERDMEEGRGTQHRHQGDAPRPRQPLPWTGSVGAAGAGQYQRASRSLRLLIYKWGIWASQGPLVEVVPPDRFHTPASKRLPAAPSLLRAPGHLLMLDPSSHTHSRCAV